MGIKHGCCVVFQAIASAFYELTFLVLKKIQPISTPCDTTACFHLLLGFLICLMLLILFVCV